MSARASIQRAATLNTTGAIRIYLAPGAGAMEDSKQEHGWCAVVTNCVVSIRKSVFVLSFFCRTDSWIAVPVAKQPRA